MVKKKIEVNFRHFGLVVNNINKSANFYKTYFEFQIIKSTKENQKFINTLLNIKNSNLQTVKMSDTSGQIRLELLKFKNLQSKNNIKRKKLIIENGFTHFALTVNNIENIYKKMKKNKITVLSKPLMSDDKKHYVFFCRDVEKNFIEVVQKI